jgi:mannosyltransferase
MDLPKNFLKKTLFPYWQIICVTVLGAFLRFYHIGVKSLWIDEAFSFRSTQLPLSQIWGAQALVEPNPPLYYTLLKLWILCFGESETALRSLSAVNGILTIPLIYVLGRALGKQQLGFIAALLLAISPINIKFSQEARGYSLLTLAITLVILGLVGLLLDPEGSKMPIGQAFIQNLFSKPSSDSRSRAKPTTDLAWLAYIVGLSLAFYVHSTAVFLPVISSIGVSVFWMRDLRFNKTFFWNWIIANTLILVVWAWWITFMLRQTHLNSWIPFTPIKNAILILNEVWIEPGLEPERILKACKYSFFLSLASLGLWRWRNNIDKLTLINTFLVGFPLLVFIVSLYRPLFIPRVFLWTTIPLYLLLASGILAFRSRFLTILIVTILFTLQLRSTVNYYRQSPQEPWNQVANHVASQMRKGDIMLFYPTSSHILLNYYFPSDLSKIVHYGLVHSYPETKYLAFDNTTALSIADIPNTISTVRRVWFVRRYLSQVSEEKKISTATLNALNQNMHQMSHLSFVPNTDLLDVFLFENTEEPSRQFKLNQDNI